MRYKSKKRAVLKFEADAIIASFFEHFFASDHGGIECEVMVAVVWKCQSSYDETVNPLAVCHTSYSELSRVCKIDWRKVRRTLEELERLKYIKIQQKEKSMYIMCSIPKVYKEDTTKMSHSESKEEKQRRKILSPAPPFLIKEEKPKEEKGVGKEESTHTNFATLSEPFEVRKQRFMESIKPYVEKYGADLCNEFFGHWTEPTQDGLLMRFELQKTWNVGVRLSKWRRTEWDDRKRVRKSISTISESVREEIEQERERVRRERNERAKNAATPEQIRKILGDKCVI